MVEFTILENSHGQYAISENLFEKSCPVISQLSTKKIWEHKTIEFIQENINDKSIVHAGTYIGDMLPAISKSTKGKVFAFEANPDTAECAKKTIEINGLGNILFHEMGLGDKKSKQDLIFEYQDGKSLGGGSRLDFEDQRENRYTLKTNKRKTIDITTIDSVVNEEVSIIQLDIEGFEMKALMGGIETIRKYKPILILENVSGDEEFMQSDILPLGYRRFTKVDENTVWKVNG
jgi:FkbM family methyltransferase